MSAPPSAESLAIQINPTISARVRQTLGVTDESPRIRLKGLEKTVRNLDGAGITNLLGALGVVSPTGLAEPRKLFARKP